MKRWRWPRYDGQLLMEQMVVGDELTVAILGDVALPSIRIVPKGQWYDYNAKYIAEDTQYLCRAWTVATKRKSGASRWPRSVPPAAVAGAAWT
jgi:D-alanine-D-alanine ligase-like ATP-grasp enzyme